MMVLIYILSIISLSSLFVEKTQPIQVDQVENENTINVRTIKPQNIQNADKINLWTETGGDNTQNTGIENPDIQNEDEYEEIIFQDNFDKEYRSGTENNYLED